jgi:hypothetical protein
MNITWLILTTVVFIVIQSYIYSKWGLARINYSRSFSKKAVFEGEKIEMIDEIVNKKLLPLPWLRLESKIHANLKFQQNTNANNEINSEFHSTLFSLLPFQKITRRHKLQCTKRGYYLFRAVSMSTGDVFGFGGTFKSVESSADVIVYPKILAMDEIPLPSHSWLGDIIVKRWIIDDPFVLAGVREYSYGDPMNTVNWKATARTGSLQVSKRDFTADHHLMIYLNFDESEDIWRSTQDEELIEKGISYAASIAQYTISKGISTGFGCNSYIEDPNEKSLLIKQSVRIEPESSKHQANYLFETLAKLKMVRSMSFNQFLMEDIDRQLERTDILLITSILTGKMKEHIKRLEALGNSVEILWLNNDEDIENPNIEVGERYAQ